MENKRIKILLIEDNPADARIVQEEISEDMDNDFYFDWEKSLSSAQEKLLINKYDLILLDLSLPDSSGIDTFQKLYSSNRSIPIVVLSGLKDELLALSAVGKGAQDYLVKGELDSKLLVKTIKYSIERHKVLENLQSQENIFSAISENINELVLIISTDGQLIRLNKKLLNLLGSIDLQKINFYNLLHVEDRQNVKSFLDEKNKTKIEGKIIYKISNSSNGFNYLESSVIPLVNNNGNVDKYVFVSKNITEFKNIEDELKKVPGMS